MKGPYANPGNLSYPGGLWVPPTAAEYFQQDGLVAEFRFDEGSGQSLTDYKSGNNGQLGSTSGSDTNDPTWASGKLTFGLSDWVEILAAEQATGEGSMTVFAVVMTTNRDAGNQSCLGGNCLSFELASNTGGLARVRWFTGSAVTVQEPAATITNNTPIVLAGRLNIDTDEGTIWTSDGSALNNRANASVTGNDRTDPAYFLIGNSTKTDASSWNGDVYLVLLYNVAKSDSDMAAIYQQIKTYMSAVKGISV